MNGELGKISPMVAKNLECGSRMTAVNVLRDRSKRSLHDADMASKTADWIERMEPPPEIESFLGALLIKAN